MPDMKCEACGCEYFDCKEMEEDEGYSEHEQPVDCIRYLSERIEKLERSRKSIGE